MSETPQPSARVLCDRLLSAVSALAGPDFACQGDAWDQHFQPARNLLWQVACATYGAGQTPADPRKCQEVLGKLQDAAIRRFVEREYGPNAYQRLLLQVHLIAAAAATARDPAGTDRQRYLDAAKTSMLAAGSPFADAAKADAMLAVGIDRLCRGQQAVARAETYLLLIGDQNQHEDVAARFVFELLPGDAKTPLPDPLLSSITLVDGSIVEYVHQAWENAQPYRDKAAVQKHEPPANRAVWWIESPSPLAGIDGPSAQASIYAAARSLIERVPLDSAVAVSATLDLNQPALPLGPVAGGDRKWRLVNKVKGKLLLVHPDTAAPARKAIPADQQASLPELKAVETFEEAWKELTGEARILGACRDDAEQQWLDQWSRIIDGDTVTPIQRNPKTGKLELGPASRQ